MGRCQSTAMCVRLHFALPLHDTIARACVSKLNDFTGKFLSCSCQSASLVTRIEHAKSCAITHH
eukprot:scaffold182385_cov35-Tisochrysis_lutea.AAC.1